MYASLTTPIGKIFQPLLDAVGAVLAFFYSIIPNYPIDVALLTIVIMALLTPLTVKSTKNMAAMQALGPEMKKLQQKYKGAENRAQMNEEMMKLYKEHNVNPASGCLPMLLQMPAFFILYSVIRGLTNTVTTPAHAIKVAGVPTRYIPEKVVALPRYIPTNSAMYHDIKAAHGQLISFGMDFSDKLLSHHSSIWAAIPYLILVIASVGLQYLQMSRLNARNPQAAQANPQAAMMQKYMPLIFGFIYLNVAALLNIYFIFSSAIRIGTQEVLFRKGIVGQAPNAASGAGAGSPKGPVADRSERALPKPKAIDATATAKSKTQPNGKNGKGRVASTSASAGGAAGPKSPTRAVGAKKAPATSSNGSNGKASSATRGAAGTTKSVAKVSSNGSNRSEAAATVDSEQSASKDHPRSKAKRERKAR